MSFALPMGRPFPPWRLHPPGSPQRPPHTRQLVSMAINCWRPSCTRSICASCFAQTWDFPPWQLQPVMVRPDVPQQLHAMMLRVNKCRASANKCYETKAYTKQELKGTKTEHPIPTISVRFWNQRTQIPAVGLCTPPPPPPSSILLLLLLLPPVVQIGALNHLK